MLKGIILLAHGSRDPLWKQPIEAIALQIRQVDPATLVRCAYLELTAPALADCATELVAQGVGEVTVFPLFLGMGKHARDDLPVLMQQLRSDHPTIKLHLKTAMGEDSSVIALLAKLALAP